MNTENDNRVAVIGRSEETLPFLAIGAEVFVTDNYTEAGEAVLRFAKSSYPVIMISDDLMVGIKHIIDRYSASPLPSITAIPGKSGKSTISKERLNAQVKKAIGIDIKGLKDK